MLKKVYLQFTIHSSRFTKALAFTLAETLIVMGIIGVVAALTLPNLNSSTGNKEKVAKVKKIYSNLEDAVGRAQAVYGPVETWFNNDSNNDEKTKRAAERISDFMKYSKVCAAGASGCFLQKYATMANPNTYKDIKELIGNTKPYSYILADGSSILITFLQDYIIYIYIDIDGPNKGKNIYGIDLHQFDLSNGQFSIPVASSFLFPLEVCFNGGGYGLPLYSTCTSWVLHFDNMDYLQTSNGNTCSNGGTILDGSSNTTCK